MALSDRGGHYFFVVAETTGKSRERIERRCLQASTRLATFSDWPGLLDHSHHATQGGGQDGKMNYAIDQVLLHNRRFLLAIKVATRSFSTDQSGILSSDSPLASVILTHPMENPGSD